MEGEEEVDMQEGSASSKPDCSKVNKVVPKDCMKVRESKRTHRATKNSVDLSTIDEKALSVNDVLDGLCSSKSWLCTNIFPTPPDGNCSDEEDPQLCNLSKRQLLSTCELQVVRNDDDEVQVICDKEGLANIDEAVSMDTDPVTSANNWPIAQEIEQQELKNLIDSFEPPKNDTLQALDHQNSTWTHIHTFELFFDDTLLDFIIEMTNQYAIGNAPSSWTPIDEDTLFSCSVDT